jgi:hypothetical protein
MSSIAATMWNIHVTRKCAIVVDMITRLDQKTGTEVEGFWAMRDSIFLLSVINQYNINKNRLFGRERETELLIRQGIFRADLKGVRAAMAERIRRDGRHSVVPLFISLLWFTISMILSIIQAFGDLGENATGHNLAMGLLVAWLPVFATASIVDRNPGDADYVRDELNDLFKTVERSRTRKVEEVIAVLSTFENDRLSRVVELASKPQTEDVRRNLVEELDRYPQSSTTTSVEGWQDPIYVLREWVQQTSNTGPSVLQEFCGQGRYPWHLGVTHPILRTITKQLPKGRGWLGDYEMRSEQFVRDNEKGGSFSVSFYSLPLPILTGVAVVGASFFGAYWISYNEPTVGLGCRVRTPFHRLFSYLTFPSLLDT